ncbi:MAG: alpha/beta hydrolase family protein, partial [Candidatus Micrarchaeaceae archaeon]
LFYLAMRRPLDYLAENPHVDAHRIGITGLSGGGWQTIMLSALDPRVKAAIPVAGFESIFPHLAKISAPGRPPEGIGDMEENPADLYTVLDYPALVAMRAPRPTLLIYDATDDCCFRAPLVKPLVFDAVRPFFELYGKRGSLQWYENLEPGTHNYELNNREQSYRFFSKVFGLPIRKREIPVQTEIRSYDELRVGVPTGNLTMLGLAKKFAAKIHHPDAAAPWAADAAKLRAVIRYQPETVKHPWAIANTRAHGLESIAYRFQLSNGLSATGIWVKEIETPKTAPLVIFMGDKGKRAAPLETAHGMPCLSDLLDRGNQVLVLDPLFTPAVSPQRKYSWAYAELLSAMGTRALGIETAQLIAIAKWAQDTFTAPLLNADTYGIRSEVIALAAAALDPKLLSRLAIHKGMRSLQYLLDAPVTYEQAPDLFCPDLYRDFDLDQLRAMAAPTKVKPITDTGQ